MSDPPDRPQIAGMLAAPPEHPSGASDHDGPQPRQPSSLHGLLRFAMDATKAEDAPSESSFGSMDMERKRFLEEALQSMTIDMIELLQKNIRVLRNANQLPIDGDVTECLKAFDSILEHIDRTDTAIDFHKIGGFLIFPPCLNSVHAPIRATACDLLAELSQNNPYCQKVVVDTGLLKQILELLDKDSDEDVQIKAMYALSCNVRENSEGYKVFLENNGLNVVHRSLQKPIDKLRTKTTFLLSCLCTAYPDLRCDLVKMDLLPELMILVSQERMPSHEHILSLLCQLIVCDNVAIEQCTDPRYNFKNVLTQHLKLLGGKAEFTVLKRFILARKVTVSG